MLAAAIIWLAPHIASIDATFYADVISVESLRNKIDPLLVTALIYRESRFCANVSDRKNYGLMQVRVTKRMNADCLKDKSKILDPKENIKRGVALLRYWRYYHLTVCKDISHPWWSHYQWGNRVKNPKSGFRVKQVYDELRRKFNQGTI
jgi:soluble lytic murein transglycosylase-like protein